MTHLPSVVAKICEFHDGWIVGSAARAGTDFNTIRDFDIAIPFNKWASAVQLVPRTATVNTFGGWKIELNSWQSVDIWPSDLSTLFASHLTKYIWHPSSGTRFDKTHIAIP